MSLVAVDQLGNKTRASISKKIALKNNYRLYASKSTSTVTDIKQGNTSSDKNKTQIELYGWPEKQIVFSDRVDLEGHVNSDTPLFEFYIKINSQKHRERIIKKQLSQSGKNNESTLFFYNQTVRLDYGENKIMVNAITKFGEHVTRTIHVTRKICQSRLLKYRYTLCMKPVEKLTIKRMGFIDFLLSFPDMITDQKENSNLSPNNQNNFNTFENYLYQNLLIKNRFNIIPTQKTYQTFNYNKDIPITKSNPTGEKNLFDAANLIGTLNETREGIEAIARLVDNKTGKIFMIKDSYSESKGTDAYQVLSKELSQKIVQSLPLSCGRIKSLLDKQSFISEFPDIPNEIPLNWLIIVYRKKIALSNTVTGNYWGADDEIISYGRVDEISKNGNYSQRIIRNDEVLLTVDDNVVVH